MEQATNLIFLIADCSAGSGGNAVKTPPRVHLAETKSLVQAAACGSPSSAWQTAVGSVESHSTCPTPQPQPSFSQTRQVREVPVRHCVSQFSGSPSRPKRSRGDVQCTLPLQSHLEPRFPGKHYNLSAEGAAFLLQGQGSQGMQYSGETPSDKALHSTVTSPNSFEPTLRITFQSFFFKILHT